MNHGTIKKLILILLIVFTGFVIYLTVFLRFTLSELERLFSIFGSISIGVALLTYFAKINQDELLAVNDQITFFREKIIAKQEDVLHKIKGKYPNFINSRISLNKPNIVDLKKDFEVNFNRQLSVFFNNLEKYPDVVLNGFVLDNQIHLLNMLEEFSLKVINQGIEENAALQSLHTTFIEIVEQNAVALLFMRQVKTGSDSIYQTVLNLYGLWSKDSVKTNYIKNLETYQLITKEQKTDLFKFRKERLGF